MHVSLMQALRFSNEQSVAFVGAGGKTTAMFQLANTLVKSSPVIVTASSHLGVWQIPLADKHVVVDSGDAIHKLEKDLEGIVLVTGAIDGDRTKPVSDEVLPALSQFCKSRSIPLLIEADGSRSKPLKAWNKYEPPIPAFADVVVEVVGLTGINSPLTDESVHRSQLFSALSGLGPNETVTTEALLHVLTHPSGGLKNIPGGARRIILLNQADTPDLQSMAHGMAAPLLKSFDSVIISSLQREEIFAVHERIAGIVIAAGKASRYGQPKQLLDWKGETFVRAVTKTASGAGLDPVVVVTGAYAEEVTEAVKDLQVKIVNNTDWEKGQGTSIRTGVTAIHHMAGGCIFLLVDQPQVNTSILRALVEKHAERLYPIVAPMVIDQRANPVLCDQVTFGDLLQLDGDVGGRAIFHKHRVEYLPWHDDRLLLDVDTPEQYQRLIADDTL